MTQKIFGTDGIRGTANSYPMTAEIAVKVGMAAGLHFISGAHRHRAGGKDTRLSGYMIEPAQQALSPRNRPYPCWAYADPAVAMLTRSLRADLGVMISDSHNPMKTTVSNFWPTDISSRRCRDGDRTTARPRYDARSGRNLPLAARSGWKTHKAVTLNLLADPS